MGGKHSKAGCTKSEWSSDETYMRSLEPVYTSQPPKPTSEVLQSRMETKPSLIAKLGLVTMSAESDSMSQDVPLIDIMEFLECPVCTCFIAFPIHSCPNGHVICGICKPKIFKCPSCDVTNFTVNGLVERILKNKGVETACRNDYLGCTRRIKVWEMKHHLDDICDFRLIQCTEVVPKKCEEKYYAPKDLLQHWISFHGALAAKAKVFVSKESALPTESSLDLLGTVAQSYSLSRNSYSCLITKDNSTSAFPVTYFKLDSETFFIHAQNFEKTFHLWITMVGEESNAKKYQYSCTISSKQSELCTSQPKREVTFCGIHVQSLQYYDFKKVRELGYSTALRIQNLKMLQDKEPSDPNGMLHWTVEIELSKVLTSTVVSTSTSTLELPSSC